MLALQISYSYVDAKGKASSQKMFIPATFSLLQAAQFAEAMAQLACNLSNAQLTGISVGLGIDLSAATLRAVAETFSDVAEKVLFVAKSVADGVFARFNIPTWDESKGVAGSDQADISDPDVDAYIEALTTGITVNGETVSAVALGGEDLDAVTVAREIFRGT